LMGGGSADLDFDHLALSANPSLSGVLFVLAILGFGAKAGFLPLHVWLPEAHPAAPGRWNITRRSIAAVRCQRRWTRRRTPSAGSGPC
ncbi:proton-conducting transporter membrane subunit, partial [Oceanibaculum nanhaiense]|uniref:proton-conducting transporter transmembrane domain-containing protein n=1 Tax=Oceanibaculum nanhaiense TaxID=1909734 RepID=UPI00396DBB79